MNQEQLKRILSEDESVYLEFKEFLDLRTNYGKAKLLREILSLANSPITRGYLIMGVEDKTKEILGVTDISEEQIQQIVTEWCHPPIRFDFEKINFHEKNVVVLQVYPVRPPYTLRKSLGYEEPATDNKKPKQGKLMTNQVFIRRGSIIGEAETEEIIEMAQKESPDLGDVVASIERLTSQVENLADIADSFPNHSIDHEFSRTIETTFVAMVTGLVLSWTWTILPTTNPFMGILFSFFFLVSTSAIRILHFGIIRAVTTSLILGMLLDFSQIFITGSLNLDIPVFRFSFGLISGIVSGIVCQIIINKLEHKFFTF